ncbi:MAG: hypothetical protein E7004_03605 [Alphaproteobacteria bacterium]|nr:hypothetical protein [Alphaproteobacteria bacterium]
MKKIVVCLLACFGLNACIYAGDVDLLPVRSKIFNLYKSHGIEYYDNKEVMIDNRLLRENHYDLNKAITVKKGEDILQDSTVEQKTYQRFVGKFNKKGVLNSKVYPMNVDSETEYTILGWATIDGEKYTLINSNVEGQVFLFDEQGKMYENIGMIEDERLILLDGVLFPYPSDLRFKIVSKMRDNLGTEKVGYQVKYGGIKFDRIFFDYLTFDSNNDTMGEFKQINFPNKPGLIVINGIGLRVLKADDNSITYMILEDNI